MEVSAQLFMRAPAEMATAVIPDVSAGGADTVEVFEETSQQFADRLRKVAKERRAWRAAKALACTTPTRPITRGYRHLHGAGQAEGNMYLHIAEYAPPRSIDEDKARRRFDDIPDGGAGGAWRAPRPRVFESALSR